MRSRAHASLSSPRAAQMGASLFILPMLLAHSIQLRRPGLPHRLTIDSTRRITASRRAKLTPSVASLLLPHLWPTQLSKSLLRQMPSRRCSRASKFATYTVSSELLTSGPRSLVMGPLYVGPSDCWSTRTDNHPILLAGGSTDRVSALWLLSCAAKYVSRLCFLKIAPRSHFRSRHLLQRPCRVRRLVQVARCV